jgi:hypothetical protein
MMASSSQAVPVDTESVPLLGKKQMKTPSPYYAVVCALFLALASGALMAPKTQFYTDIFCHR